MQAKAFHKLRNSWAIQVRVIHALIEGLVLQRLLTPELFPDEVIYAAFGALAASQAPSRQETHSGD